MYMRDFIEVNRFLRLILSKPYGTQRLNATKC